MPLRGPSDNRPHLIYRPQSKQASFHTIACDEVYGPERALAANRDWDRTRAPFICPIVATAFHRAPLLLFICSFLGQNGTFSACCTPLDLKTAFWPGDPGPFMCGVQWQRRLSSLQMGDYSVGLFLQG